MNETTERDALLFVSGQYPGKGPNRSVLTVTDADIAAIAANTGETPLIFAHDSDREHLSFGTVGALEARGNQLWGKVRLTEDAAPFVAKNGLRSLSVGLDYVRNKLKEVSFTRRPHIKDAAMFSDTCVAIFSGGSLGDLPPNVHALGDRPARKWAKENDAVLHERRRQLEEEHERNRTEPDHVKRAKSDAILAQTPEGRALLAARQKKEVQEQMEYEAVRKHAEREHSQGRRDELLSHTPLGRSVLAERKAIAAKAGKK